MNVLKKCHSFQSVVFLSAFVLLTAIAGASGQNLYVADYSNSNLCEVASGGIETTNAMGLRNPINLAFDQKGNLYIACYMSSTILELSSTGVWSTNAAGLTPTALAFDRSGNLLVANYINNNIIEYTTGGASNVFASGLDWPAGLAFDHSGNLFESDYLGNRIIEFTNNNGTLSANTNIFVGGLDHPTGLAFDGYGNLFEADNSDYCVIEFTNNNGTLSPNTNIVASTPAYPWQLAFDSTGNLYVGANGTGVTKIAPNRTHSSVGTGFNAPFAVAFMPNATLQTSVAKNKSIQLTATMPSPYYLTTVEASTNFSNWTPIYTNLPPFTYTDSAAASFSHRFYRTYTWQ